MDGHGRWIKSKFMERPISLEPLALVDFEMHLTVFAHDSNLMAWSTIVRDSKTLCAH